MPMQPVYQFVPDEYKPYVGSLTQYEWLVEDNDKDNAHYMFLGFEVWSEDDSSPDKYIEVCARFLRNGELVIFGLWDERDTSTPFDPNSERVLKQIKRTLRWEPVSSFSMGTK